MSIINSVDWIVISAAEIHSELYWVIVAFALVIVIVALILSLIFLLKKNKITDTFPASTATMSGSANVKGKIEATKGKLRAAFLDKERAELFLRKLDILKVNNGISETIYADLKEEYLRKHQKALLNIDLIQAEFKRQLDIQITGQRDIKFALENLEARLHVGQLPLSEYTSDDKNLRNKLSRLEKRIFELETLVNATGTSSISHLGGTKMPDYTLESVRTQSPPQKLATAEVNDTDQATEIEPKLDTIPKITDLEILPSCVVQGNQVGIVAMAFNDRQEDITYQIELKINGEIKQSSDVSLAPKAFQEVTFVIATDVPGDFKVEVGGLGGRFRVLPAKWKFNILSILG
jgi:hypothetical protein